MLDRLAELRLDIEAVDVARLERPTAGDGLRRTALIRLRGRGQEGLGEEVTFQELDLLTPVAKLDVLLGVATIADLWARLDEVDLFERPPEHDVARSYRRWAIEAAALDLALRQTDLSLGQVLACKQRPVRFVVSPPRMHLRRFPGVRLKINAADLEPGLPVDVIDFKGEGDSRLVERALDLYPGALLEDPPVVVSGARVSWDIGIRSAGDLDRLSARPAAINIKPARLGGMAALLELYEACAREDVAVYGGGQHELGAGRVQIQQLAALFHPEAPNDVAPSGYNNAEPASELPASPLNVPPRPGFR